MKPTLNSPVKSATPFGTNRFLDGDLEERKRGPSCGQSPVWKLISDPSDDFELGRLFNYEDLECGCKSTMLVWSHGTRFKNIKTGRIVEIRLEYFLDAKLSKRQRFIIHKCK
jgi:hypothetical protein